MNLNQIRRRYTRVVKINNKWNCYLHIDHQEFQVVEQTTLRMAQWFSKQLSIALERMLKDRK
jgi:hypothetical protein